MDLPFVEELVPAGADALTDWREGDAWLAGGTWLFSVPQPRLRRLRDLRGFGWEPLVASADGLEIAATCTLAQLRALAPPPSWPAAALLRRGPELLLASWKIWHEATVGGNLCLGLPAGSLIAVTAALDGVATVWRADGSAYEVGVAQLVTGPSQTLLAPGELLRSVRLPAAALRGTVALRQTSLSPRGRSSALVIGRRDADGGCVICVTASVPRPLVLRFDALPSEEELADALGASDIAWYDDLHGDPRWRAQLTAVLAREVRAELAGELAPGAGRGG